ncbi:translation initiation factor eIF-2B epsilon subunit, GEF [Coemansia biformis]|uniref:Translation initiation factor eIF2B subunit epsilon n=1 Tax=Coemansia biformis TaxID=1286918 RepID=A0A9W8D0V1_9FUNG|nr:translation initiation factor eIF-2B epsilon subunit, GEF [Coemansia biformis]
MNSAKDNRNVSTKGELKAIVLADLFDAPFQPLSLNRPRCLLPLCNVPMIEYTLELLATAGVAETIIVCQAQADKLLDYIRGSRWSRGNSQMKVVVRSTPVGSTVGDALRAIDHSSTVLFDFILCTGLAISNMDLTTLVAAHSARSRDGLHIMTMLLQETAPGHPRQDKSDESVYFIEPSMNRLLALSSHASVPRAKCISVQSNVITNHAEVEVRADLSDTNIAICSPDVLALFTENFDYHDMRRDFISGILELTDVLQKDIHVHVLSGPSVQPVSPTVPSATWGSQAPDPLLSISSSGYAASVTDTAAYDAISRDIISRWAYPLCPDNSPTGEVVYNYSRGAVYKTKSVRLDRESRVEHHVILGADSHVANHAYIADSVLGERCAIDEHATIRNSYLFDGTKIGRNSVVERSILGERVTVLDNVVIERACLIGDDVTVGPNVRIPAFTRLARVPPHRGASLANRMSDGSDSESDSGSDSDISDAAGGVQAAARHTSPAAGADSQRPFDTQVLGLRGVGYVWDVSSARPGSADFGDDHDGADDSDDSDNGDDTIAHQLHKLHTIGSSLNDAVLGDSDQEDEFGGEDDDADAEQAAAKPSMQDEFEREVHLTVKRGCDENLSAPQSTIELRGLRMAYNKDKEDMCKCLMQEVLRTVDIASLATSVPAALKKWGPVIEGFVGDGREQLDLMDTVERHCALEDGIDNAARSRLFVRTVYMLYQLDIVEDVAIIAWHGRAQKKPADEVSADLLCALEPVVDNLNETDESSDGDEEEDDDNEDEDEDEDSE